MNPWDRTDEEKLERITNDLRFYQRKYEKTPCATFHNKIQSLKTTRRHYMTLDQIRDEDRAEAKAKGLMKK